MSECVYIHGALRSRLNSPKSQFICLSAPTCSSRLSWIWLLLVLVLLVSLSIVVRNIGVTLDQEQIITSHIQSPAHCCSLTYMYSYRHCYFWSFFRFLFMLAYPASRQCCPDHVLRPTARLIGRIPRFDNSNYMRDVLN